MHKFSGLLTGGATVAAFPRGMRNTHYERGRRVRVAALKRCDECLRHDAAQYARNKM